MIRSHGPIAALVAFFLLTAACGDDADTTTSATTTSTTSASTTTLAEVEPTDFGERGPYEVGLRTLELPDRTVDVWYPLAEGATEGLEPLEVDPLEPFPASFDAFADLIPDVIKAPFPVDAYLDADASPDGPFPVLLHSHGAGSWRRDPAQHLAHVASWGFVTVATDHLGRDRGAMFGDEPDHDVPDDATVMLDELALVTEASETAGHPLEDLVDADNVGADGLERGGRRRPRPAARSGDRHDPGSGPRRYSTRSPCREAHRHLRLGRRHSHPA